MKIRTGVRNTVLSCVWMATAIALFASAQESTLLSETQINTRLLNASPRAIVADDVLSAHMEQLAEAAISSHCASCHGSDLTGAPGVPDLVDYDWMWDITGYETTTVEPVMSLMQTILYGIRDTDCDEDIKRYGACPDTRYSEMPAYGQLGFTEQQIDGLVEYVIDLSGGEADKQALEHVAELTGICAECHGEDGWGYRPFGGPDLTDDVWLYGGSRAEIRDVMINGRLGVCPPHENVLDPVTVKALAVYIYQQSGMLY